MTSARADDPKYARVYYLILDDPKFETIYPDDRHLATWLRLLLVADAMWPASAPVPRATREVSLKALTAVGLIDLFPGGMFRLHGLDPERKRRMSEQSSGGKVRAASAERGPGGRFLPSTAGPPLVTTAGDQHASQQVHPAGESSDPAKQRRAETSRDEQGARESWEEPEGEALTWLARHGCDIRPGNGYHQKLILAVENHGINAVIGMFDRLETAGVKRGDIKGYLFGAIDALNGRPDLKGLEAEERAEERNTALQRSIAATKRRTAELDEWRERSPEPERQAQT